MHYHSDLRKEYLDVHLPVQSNKWEEWNLSIELNIFSYKCQLWDVESEYIIANSLCDERKSSLRFNYLNYLTGRQAISRNMIFHRYLKF